VQTLLIVLFVIIAVLLVLIILLQSSKATGMGIFGGSDTVLGSGGADILTKITAGLAIGFVIIAFSISYYMSKSRTALDKEYEKVKKQQTQEQRQQAQQPPADAPTVLPEARTNP
jgi:preprotein translocase subunit SecG